MSNFSLSVLFCSVVPRLSPHPDGEPGNEASCFVVLFFLLLEKLRSSHAGLKPGSFEFCLYLWDPLEFWYWADDIIIYIHKHCLIFRLYLIGLLLCIVSTEVHTKYSCYILPTHVQYMQLCTRNTMATVYIGRMYCPLKSHTNNVDTNVNLTCYCFSPSCHTERTGFVLQTLMLAH